MSLARPEWLVLLIALPWVVWLGSSHLAGLARWRRWTTVALRAAVVTLLALAAAELQWLEESDELTVFYLFDVSKSMPETVQDPKTLAAVSLRKSLLDYMRAASERKKADDQVGLIVFGRDAQIEKSPDISFPVEDVHSIIARDYTNIGGAIRLADAAFPAGSRRRIVVFSDGAENLSDAMEAARAAHGRGVDILVYPVRYPERPEVMIDRLIVPPDVRLAETFPVRVVVSAHQTCDAEVVLLRDGQPAQTQPERVRLAAGEKRVVQLFDRIPYSVGFHHYEARIKPADATDDAVRENNVAHAYAHVQSEASVLVIAPSEQEVRPLLDALRGERIAFDLRSPENIPTSRGAFQDYDCVVLANVTSGAFTDSEHMKMLQSAVRNAGVGLIMIGGEDSFGSGGWRGTPVEETLPVDMDVKEKEILTSGALAIILHTCEIEKGNYWAKRITKAAITALGPSDYAGVLFYDWQGGNKWLFTLQPVSNRVLMFDRVDKCEPGDMPDFASTMSMALGGLLKVNASARHCIVISDGDASPPDQPLLDRYIAGKVTITTIGIGIQNHGDPAAMRNIASQTGGRYYEPSDPRKLPQIFVKEARIVRRSLICNELFTPTVNEYDEMIAGFAGEGFPPLEAFVVTTPKDDPKVQMPLVARVKGETSPLLAHWKYGLGKATAFTSDASTNWAKHWVAWNRFGNFWTQVIRGTMRQRKPGDIQITTRVDGDKGTVLVDAIDDSGAFVNFLELTGRVELPDYSDAPVKLSQVAPGRYQGEFPAEQTGTYHVTVRYTDSADGEEKLSFSGASVSYSPEYRTFQSNDPLLESLAAVSGKDFIKLDPEKDGVFKHDLRGTKTPRPLWPRLLALAGLLFLLDVFFRRVMIDWEKLWAALMRRAAAWLPYLGGRWAAKERPDPTVAALLKKKAELREAAPRPIEVSESEFFKALKEASARAKAEIKPEVEPARPSETELRKAVEEPKAAEPEKPIGFTARLLDAKRRAEEDRKRGRSS